MRTKCLEHLPHCLVTLVVVECCHLFAVARPMNVSGGRRRLNGSRRLDRTSKMFLNFCLNIFDRSSRVCQVDFLESILELSHQIEYIKGEVMERTLDPNNKQ